MRSKFEKLILITLKWGSLLGISLAFIQVIFSIKLMTGSRFMVLSPILTILSFCCFIYLALKDYKKWFADGTADYARIFPCGLLVTLIASVIFFILMYTCSAFLIKNMVPQKKADAISHLYQETFAQHLSDSDLVVYQNLVYDKMQKSCQEMATIKQPYSDSLLTELYSVFQPNLTKLDSANRCLDSIHSCTYKILSLKNDSLCHIYQTSKNDFNYTDENQFIFQIISRTYEKMCKDSVLLKSKTAENIKHIEQQYTPLNLTLAGTFSILLYGFFFSIFITLFFSKHKKRFFEKGFAEDQKQEPTKL